MEFVDFQECDEDLVIENQFVIGCADFLHENYQIDHEASYAIARCLFSRMSDTRLHYHTPIHVLCMLDFAQIHNIPLSAPEILAIWFHDAIYEPNAQSGQNEEQSKLFMESLMAVAGPDYQDHILDAGAMIRATAKHLETGLNPNWETVLDLDLSGFSYGLKQSKVVTKAIRDEYPQYTDAEFNVGRKQFLKQLIAKGFVYRTPLFKEKFENIALANIQEELK
jgi:predicted metal-dependent HD superfamily phosphohydrolase